MKLKKLKKGGKGEKGSDAKAEAIASLVGLKNDFAESNHLLIQIPFGVPIFKTVLSWF